MAEISHSASGPLAKGLEYLSFSDRNTYLFCCIVAFAALLLFNPLTDFPWLLVCTGYFEMDQDSSSKLMASLLEMLAHLKRTKNLLQPKRQRQPLQPSQPRRQRWRSLRDRLLLQVRTILATVTVLIEVFKFALSLKG
jgi:hypothetical protein